MSQGQGNVSFSGFSTNSGGGGGTGLPAPPDMSVQFNSGSVFGGSANLLWNPATNQLEVAGTVKANALYLPNSDDSGIVGDILINGATFFNTYEPVPIDPGVPSSIFFGWGSNNLTGTNTGSVVNIGIGLENMTAITTAENNIAIGIQALQSLTSGLNNLGIGSSSLQPLTTGIENTAIGVEALQFMATGSGNTALGAGAGKNATGSNNIFIGRDVLLSQSAGDFTLAIGSNPGDTVPLPFIFADMASFSGRWNGQLGINFQTPVPGLPTAQLHIAASSGAAGTAPIKLSAGILLGTPEVGAIEYDGTHFYATTSTGVRQIITIV